MLPMQFNYTISGANNIKCIKSPMIVTYSILPNTLPLNASYLWSIDGTLVANGSYTGPTLDVLVPNYFDEYELSTYIRCKVTVPGATYNLSKQVMFIHCSYPYKTIAYPNPATNVLNVEILDEEKNQNYDIRLYDSQGILLRQKSTKGRKVEFNVDDLVNGIFYLHIYDGVNENPEIQQVLIER